MMEDTTLPDEVLHLIMCQLSPVSLLKARCVCAQWRRVARNTTLPPEMHISTENDPMDHEQYWDMRVGFSKSVTTNEGLDLARFRGVHSLSIYLAPSNVCESKARLSTMIPEWNETHDLDTGIFAESRIVDLRISCRFLTGIDALRNVEVLDIECKNSQMDVSALSRVPNLTLSYCHGLVDVSALGNVTSLTLHNCYALRDVSALGGVRYLNLSGCIGIKDVSALGDVETLSLSRCRKVRDVSMLGRLRSLNICGCPLIEDVSALGGLEELRMGECYLITDVSALCGLSELTLYDCTGVTDTSVLSAVPNLRIIERSRSYGDLYLAGFFD